MPIRHIWFDFSDTIAEINQNVHDGIKYGAFAELSDIPDSSERHQAYQQLYEKYGHSNSAIFVEEFGKSPKYWSDLIGSSAAHGLYRLKDSNIPDILRQLSDQVSISIFSNIDTKKALTSFGIDINIFRHILSSADLKYPKPHLDGYQKLVELSNLPPQDILYIGDIEDKDVLPAKAVGLQAGIIWNKSNAADYNFRSFQDIVDLIERHAE